MFNASVAGISQHGRSRAGSRISLAGSRRGSRVDVFDGLGSRRGSRIDIFDGKGVPGSCLKVRYLNKNIAH